MEKMRAMVLTECGKIETNPLKSTNIDKHQIERANEVLLKIEACGVCHSNFMELKEIGNIIGIPASLPIVPGHEVVGKIIEIGKDVTKFKIGDRVGINSTFRSM